ncbi:hypothetical protein E2542_SST22931 [Spatholobus suberectus]|nr:hypothetical protein E2542_SST22931 [Spatholobus suberectus]
MGTPCSAPFADPKERAQCHKSSSPTLVEAVVEENARFCDTGASTAGRSHDDEANPPNHGCANPRGCGGERKWLVIRGADTWVRALDFGEDTGAGSRHGGCEKKEGAISSSESGSHFVNVYPLLSPPLKERLMELLKEIEDGVMWFNVCFIDERLGVMDGATDGAIVLARFRKRVMSIIVTKLKEHRVVSVVT